MIFCWFLCTKLFFTLFAWFSVDLSRKIDENSMKKRCVFSHRRLFFSTWRPSWNIVFYNTKATFSFFAFLRFFWKNHRKTCSEIEATFFPSKITQKSSPGTRFGSQNRPELTSEEPKIAKIVQKTMFFSPSRFLSIFWDTETPYSPKGLNRPETEVILKNYVSVKRSD